MILHHRTSQKYRATKLPLWALQILIIFFPFLGLLLKETIIKHSIYFFVGHKWNFVNGFVFIKLVFYVFLMQSIWCTDRPLDVFCKLNQSTKKWNSSGRINLLLPCPFGAWKNNYSELMQLAKCLHLLNSAC